MADLVGDLGALEFWLTFAGAAAVAAVAFAYAFVHLHRARLIEDVPTSRVRSASQGYVELEGIGRLLDGPVISAPLSGARCTWWSIRVEERGGRNERRWVTRERASSDELFVLEDDTGRCVIDPEGARVYPSVSESWYGDSARPAGGPRKRLGGRYRYSEKRMHPGEPLYAIGFLRTHQAGQGWRVDEEARELLREWKRDRAGLLRRFDANGDGDIDLGEWERARQAAHREVRELQREAAAAPGLSVLGAPPDDRPFLLGTLPQAGLAARLRRRALAELAGFLAAGAGAVWLLVTRLA